MAPEVLDINDVYAPYDPMLADIWSLGVCLFHLVNRCLPFLTEGLYNHQILRRQREKAWSFAPEVKNLITQMLEPDPKKRLTIVGVMRHPWTKSTMPPNPSTGLDKPKDK